MIVNKTGKVLKSNHSQTFFEIGALKNFAIFTGKCLFIFDKLAGLQFYKKEIPTQEFSCEYYKILRTLPVATFGYSNQSRIFQQITTLKFQGQHASQSNFCRYKILCPATKTEISRRWFRWNFENI